MSKCANCGLGERVRIRTADLAGVAERWRANRFRDKGWCAANDQQIYENLCALGNSPTAKDITSIIGNPSWAHVMCTACIEYKDRCIAIDTGDGEALICESCLRGSLEALTK